MLGILNVLVWPGKTAVGVAQGLRASRTSWLPRLGTVLRGTASWALDGVFAVLLLMAQFDMPTLITTPDLDPSWRGVLQHFLTTHAQAGRDYVFTYGPLGAMIASTYDADTYWLRYAWELLIGTIITGVTVALGRRIQARDLRILFYTCLIVYVLGLPDLRFELTLLELAVLLLVSAPRPAVLVLSGLLFAVISLVKFTYAVFAVPAVFLVAVSLWRDTGRRSMLFLLPVSYALSLAAIWLALGQSLTNLPSYVAVSLEVAAGYADAMSLVLAPYQVRLGVIVAALIALAGLATVGGVEHKRRFLICVVLALFLLYLKFRHGFVRHDGIFFFAFALTVPFVIVAAGSLAMRSWPLRLSLGISLFLSIVGLHTHPGFKHQSSREMAVRAYSIISSHASLMARPSKHHAALEQSLTQHRRTHALPRVKAVVGNRPIDMVSFNQGVLLLNDLNYVPRPIFQGYSAYTPRLLALNEAFYRSPNGPEFVLSKVGSIDGRIPAGEDGGVFLELLRNYSPVLKEKGYLLMKRRDGQRIEPPPAREVTQKTIRFNEEVAVAHSADECQTLSLEFKSNVTGKLLNILYRNPLLHLNVRLKTGEVRKYRLIPGIAASGFLLNPLVENDADFIDVLFGKASKQVASLSVTQEEFHRTAPYGSDIQMTLRTYPADFAQPNRIAPDMYERIRHSTLGAPPQRVEAPPGHTFEIMDGGLQCFVVAVGTITYNVTAEQRRVSGIYGVAPMAYDPSPNNQPLKSDGVAFAVEYVPTSGKRIELWRKRLDPARCQADRGTHPFSVELPPGAAGGTVELRVFDEPPNHTGWDWGYWSQIAIE